MFCPRKPQPFGTEYHSICCGLCCIMFGIDLLKGSDNPPELPNNIPSCHGPTVSLLLCMCCSLFFSGCVPILDSGFCALKGIVELFKKGVYVGAVIKKALLDQTCTWWCNQLPNAFESYRICELACGEIGWDKIYDICHEGIWLHIKYYDKLWEFRSGWCIRNEK